MTGWNIDVPTTDYYGPWPGEPMHKFDADALQALVNELQAQPLIAIDTETTGLTVWKDLPLYWSLAWGNRRCTLHAGMLHYFKDVFADPTKWWVMANAKYDTHILANVGTFFAGQLVDTQVQHALLYEDKPHGLKFMSKHILGWTWGDFQDTFGKIGKRQSAEDVIRKAEREDFPLLVEYAANDAWGTLGVYNELRKQLERAGTHSLFRDKPPHIENLWDLFYKVEIPYTKCLWRMERHGIKVDRQTLEKARPQAEAELSRIGRELYQLRGRPININSTQQLREWLIDEKGLKPVKWTKGGKKGVRAPSLDVKFLQHYAEKGVRECELILQHRDYAKLLGTYINGLHELLDPCDRIHSRFNQDVARTGRLSSSDPNLQNIPRPENDHWNLRGAFVPEDGYDMLCLDYAQLEMRLLAAASLEKSMIDMIHSGKDIHIGNAEIVFGLPYDDIKAAKKKEKADLTAYDKECMAARAAVKNIGFGILYGMGPQKMANDLGITQEEAEAKIAQFLNTYPAVKAFTEEAVRETERTGYAFTVLGRRRNIPEIASSSRSERSRGERLAVNTQIQGSAADVVKLSQILYDKLGFERDTGCRMVLQVHDELVFECPKEHTQFMLGEIQEMMEHPFSEDLKVHLEADGGRGDSWGEAK
jgi:DNA polymerase-1